MIKIFVYRIQNHNGSSPYEYGQCEKWLQSRPDHANLQPWFVEFGRADKMRLSFEHSASACKTIEQLRRWFTKGEYNTLKKLGYFAVKMPVTRILSKSDIQVYFSRPEPLNENIKVIELY